ncbi:type II toxin-antitoxin system death-on-curing family toxin [Myroides pelagicus]|uniref:type II toxin-antitoxin system death-on-curing family toxin n=1 Tax=Myroides pelagicus TaxID=270914 RepID=UPI002DBBF2E2|nr:type II toxin-antitoxin system death-on-curing family toxin [Myroides pelagicus]MEC4115140.1 type II toxin-antitoxin system death-on-curing family toxin [Myroides pelagicus]
MNIIRIPTEYAIKVHDKIIEISGGQPGVKNFGNLDSPLSHLDNDDYYPTFEDKLTHLVFSVNKLHAFNDGNKRTSIALGAFFLQINGLEYCIDKFIIEMENIAVLVADNIIDKEFLNEIIFSIMNEEDYNEEIKLKIFNALSNVIKQDSLGIDFYKFY